MTLGMHPNRYQCPSTFDGPAAAYLQSSLGNAAWNKVLIIKYCGPPATDIPITVSQIDFGQFQQVTNKLDVILEGQGGSLRPFPTFCILCANVNVFAVILMAELFTRRRRSSSCCSAWSRLRSGRRGGRLRVGRGRGRDRRLLLMLQRLQRLLLLQLVLGQWQIIGKIEIRRVFN